MALATMLVVASLLAHQAAGERDAATRQLRTTQQVLSATSELEIQLLQAVRGQRGYLLTGDRMFLQPFEEARPQIAGRLEQLEIATRSDAPRHEMVGEIRDKSNLLLQDLSDTIANQADGDHDGAVDRTAIADGRRQIESVSASILQFEQSERELLETRLASANAAAAETENYQYSLTLVGFLLLALGISVLVSLKRSVRRESEIRNELRRIAATDELTGLANRREFLAALDRAVAGAKRRRAPLAVAMLDIDHFKRINDTFGHPAGDAVLRRVALTAVDIVRAEDLVGRLGGEEFAVILPAAPAQSAFDVCERLRLAVQSSDLELETGSAISVTLSTGIAALGPHDTAESLLARADQALYDAKNGGRDRVLLAA
ncbi:diguanylate cyclase [Alteriqipengyuania flavescens]|uniref:GGDEF domain-containing protein n=1 Tax=Alteriqipengyuania flavescens TaxID=3053610 RepID=UPI0025B2FED6|nr:diguanylate cyclase [Alteriqipengyuania flavescens]WJY18492.1 diguanylate cyclase [Alteriqipengyuania flavescens]WJY24433.1 diguanylate cyclase [Alteriqipengyuania flavescens]